MDWGDVGESDWGDKVDTTTKQANVVTAKRAKVNITENTNVKKFESPQNLHACGTPVMSSVPPPTLTKKEKKSKNKFKPNSTPKTTGIQESQQVKKPKVKKTQKRKKKLDILVSDEKKQKIDLEKNLYSDNEIDPNEEEQDTEEEEVKIDR